MYFRLYLNYWGKNMENYVAVPNLDTLSEMGHEWLNEVLPSFDFSAFTNEIISGENIFKPDNILTAVLRMFAKELYNSIKILAVIIAIIVISALLENLRSSFNKTNSYGQEVLIVALLGGLAGELFVQSGTYAVNISSDITKLMWAILPVMATLTAGCGFVSTATFSNPVLYFMCSVFAEIFNRVLMPLSTAYLCISLVDLMTDTIKLTKFRELIKKAYNFILGIVMTVFTGLLTVSSFAGVSLDSVGAKGVKFAVSNMVPFVGRSISDAMSAVVSASMLLKNAVGITGIVVMIAICVIPVIKTATTIIAIRISAAVCEMIAGKKAIDMLSSVGDSLTMINAAVIATVVMMIISLSIIVGIG